MKMLEMKNACTSVTGFCFEVWQFCDYIYSIDISQQNDNIKGAKCLSSGEVFVNRKCIKMLKYKLIKCGNCGTELL